MRKRGLVILLLVLIVGLFFAGLASAYVDTDNGKKPLESGKINDNSGNQVEKDSCVDGNTVREWYTTWLGLGYESDDLDCPTGFPYCSSFSNGAKCVQCPPGSGPCCTASGQYVTSITACDSYDQYQCSGGPCGAGLATRDVTRYCSGSTSSCDGPTNYGAWHVTGQCGSSQKCTPSGVIVSSPVTCQADSSCTTCTPNDYKGCSGANIYWFNSCNTQGNFIQNCNTGSTNVCLDPDGSGGDDAFCAECGNDDDCSGSDTCNTETGVCESASSCGDIGEDCCSGSPACNSGTCNSGTGKCESSGCTSNDDCDGPGNKDYCDTDSGTCVECTSNSHCDDDTLCPTDDCKIYNPLRVDDVCRSNKCEPGNCNAVDNKPEGAFCGSPISCTDTSCKDYNLNTVQGTCNNAGVCNNANAALCDAGGFTVPNLGGYCGTGRICSTGSETGIAECSYDSTVSVLEFNKTCTSAGECGNNMGQVNSVTVCESKVCYVGADGGGAGCTTCGSGVCNPSTGECTSDVGNENQPCKADGTCNSPYTCQDHVCAACSIDELFWQKNGKKLGLFVTEEQDVEVVVSGNGCSGSGNSVDFVIRDKDDTSIKNDEDVGFDSDGFSEFGWKTTLDGETGPKLYYFEAALNGAPEEGNIEETNITVVKECTTYVKDGERKYIERCADYSNTIEGIGSHDACLSDCAHVTDSDTRTESGPNGEVGSCVWVNNNCSFGYAPIGAGPSADYYCRVGNQGLPECSEDQATRTITINYLMHNVTSGTEINNSALCHGTGSCASSSVCETAIPCPKVAVLPFFTWINGVAVIILIAVVYIVNHYARHRAKKRKK